MPYVAHQSSGDANVVKLRDEVKLCEEHACNRPAPYFARRRVCAEHDLMAAISDYRAARSQTSLREFREIHLLVQIKPGHRQVARLRASRAGTLGRRSTSRSRWMTREQFENGYAVMSDGGLSRLIALDGYSSRSMPCADETKPWPRGVAAHATDRTRRSFKPVCLAAAGLMPSARRNGSATPWV